MTIWNLTVQDLVQLFQFLEFCGVVLVGHMAAGAREPACMTVKQNSVWLRVSLCVCNVVMKELKGGAPAVSW